MFALVHTPKSGAMIDFRAHLIALAGCEAFLGVEQFVDPGMIFERDRQLGDVADHRGVAMVGALIDHVIAHAASDGSELALLERAAEFWAKGTDIYTAIGDCRADIEAALIDPADPQSVASFNAALERFRKLAVEVNAVVEGIQSIRDDVAKFAHLTEHPRQTDQPLDAWPWGDVLLARRTDAFVRSTYDLAQEPDERAFAFGVLACYSGNVTGSGYLNQVVGGPRRSHRFRDRLARNSVGSWFSQSFADATNLGEIAAQLRLPAGVQTLIGKALEDTYDIGVTGPVPNVSMGYQRLVRHLELLGRFSLPAPPALPREPFLTRLYDDPTTQTTPIVTGEAMTAWGLHPTGGGPAGGPPHNYAGTAAPNQTDSAPTTAERCGSFWLAVLYLIMDCALGFIYCIAKWAQGDRCELTDAIAEEWQNANRPTQEQMDQLAAQGAQPLTVEGLTAAADAAQMTTMVGRMFDAESLLWEGLSRALAFLSLHGLVYPDSLLNQPAFGQFTSIPAPVPLPRKPQPDPAATMHVFPATPLEQPQPDLPRYPIGARPGVMIEPAGDLLVRLWTQIARGERDSENLDLDADRGLQHPCWATGGSIDDNPVTVDILGYADL